LGGDFYDFIELPDGDLGICIADVSGKGIPAALFMASIRSTLRAYAPTSDDVTRIIRHVNRQMCNDTQIGEFATLFYSVLSTQDRRLVYCNAGHQPPLILRNDRFVELLSGGMALGIRLNEAFECGQTELRPGDLVVMITDGVTDALNFQGLAYGRERLLTSIWKHRRLDAAQLAAQLHWDVRRFAGLAEQADDITIVVVKVL
jgi:sigma-B regulation protein RsbU (phosphoserine phosphatase)